MSSQGHILLVWYLLIISYFPLFECKYPIYDEKVPEPTGDNFRSCKFHTMGAHWNCWDNAISTYNVDEKGVLYDRWPRTAPECCSVWEAHQCLNISLSLHKECQDKEVVNYYQQIQDVYIENGCSNFRPGKYDCKNGSSVTRRINQWLLLVASIFVVALMCRT